MKLILRIIRKIGRILRPILLTPCNMMVFFSFKKNKNDKKFVIVSHDSSLSGAPNLVLNMAKVMRKEGYYVLIVSIIGGQLKDKFKENSDKSIFYPSKVIFNLLKRSEYNILVNTIVAGCYVKRIKGKKNHVVTLIHEMPEVITNLLKIEQKDIDGMTSISDTIVFPSKYNLSIFEDAFGVISIDKRIMPQGLYKTNPISISDKEAKKRVCERYNIDEDASIYISCAFISEIKGFDFFYSLAKDYKYDKKVHFIWAGSDNVNYYDKFMNQVGDKELPKNLTVTGYISNQEELTELYQASTYFLMLSRKETFPSTILEAFSMGKPVIAFDRCGGYVEIMNESNGYLVEPYDLSKIYEILNKTSPNDKKYQEMSINSKKLIKESFDFNKYVNNLLKLYPFNN